MLDLSETHAYLVNQTSTSLVGSPTVLPMTRVGPVLCLHRIATGHGSHAAENDDVDVLYLVDPQFYMFPLLVAMTCNISKANGCRQQERKDSHGLQ